MAVHSNSSVRALSTTQALQRRTSTSPMFVAEKGDPWMHAMHRANRGGIELEHDVQTAPGSG